MIKKYIDINYKILKKYSIIIDKKHARQVALVNCQLAWVKSYWEK